MGEIRIEHVSAVEERIVVVRVRGRTVVLLGTRGDDTAIDAAVAVLDVMERNRAMNPADACLVVDVMHASVRPALEVVEVDRRSPGET